MANYEAIYRFYLRLLGGSKQPTKYCSAVEIAYTQIWENQRNRDTNKRIKDSRNLSIAMLPKKNLRASEWTFLIRLHLHNLQSTWRIDKLYPVQQSSICSCESESYSNQIISKDRWAVWYIRAEVIKHCQHLFSFSHIQCDWHFMYNIHTTHLDLLSKTISFSLCFGYHHSPGVYRLHIMDAYIAPHIAWYLSVSHINMYLRFGEANRIRGRNDTHPSPPPPSPLLAPFKLPHNTTIKTKFEANRFSDESGSDSWIVHF